MSKTKPGTSVKRLWNLLKLDKRDVSHILFYALFAGLINLAVPLGIQAIVNLIQGGKVSTSWVILVILVTLAVGLVGVFELLQLRLVENIQQKIFTRSSFEFSYRFPKIKSEALQNIYPPELANRFFDTLKVQKGVSKILLDLPAATVQVVFGVILLSLYHPFFILYGLLLVLLLYIVFKFTAEKGLKTSLDESKNKYLVAHWIQEVARNLNSFKISGRSRLALDKNDKLTEKYLREREEHFGILKIQYIKLIVFKVLVAGGLLAIGGMLVLNQQMNIGQFVAAEIIILLIISSVEKMIRGLEDIYDTLTSLEKLGQVVDKPLEASENQNAVNPTNGIKLEFKDVAFEPDGYSVLNGINFTLKPGESLLITGPAGNGRTSLLKLVSGIFSPTKGKIYVNDLARHTLVLNEYRQYLGTLLPDEIPFEGSLWENITFGDESISDQDIDWALEHAGLKDFVKEQNNGIYAQIHPEGRYLSTLISQRIILARAIVKKPAILILKEPFTKFEPQEKKRILKFLTDPQHKWSIIVASNDDLWKDICNERLELQDGKIVKSV
ncbi:peptidase domain-containing ABC transporter [Salegentibacter salegens]|uniref:ABC-type bacteriocin/lantibiotic exporter, contains an N-terminal double-glycine peptidase domain n=1 Tax=Salegentibacter salegens TaxID=143223 RepID=A0A1M7NPU4_9FLAO|nr:ATP-binding cassette domain-containing protein [Salegentibacter salegens]PRX40299.1 ABC-type bacteriocin/lantibiotic exporter with double-glycine peptidase domain [Salegentibacter salegens]SHN05929.1 ABC-type bacteriocin/lantibiotic exporter, contains an N-terminal double-glycine peptidase domain [Salegentibacter salegens]